MSESNTDFTQTRSVLRIRACELRQCVSVSIINDGISEDTETFTIHLEKSFGLGNTFIVDPSVKVIIITDNDGMFVVHVEYFNHNTHMSCDVELSTIF